MVRQEIYGYLLTHYALSALICRAATEAASTRTGLNSSAPSASSAAGPPTRRPFPPEQPERIPARVMADITRKKHLNCRRSRDLGACCAVLLEQIEKATRGLGLGCRRDSSGPLFLQKRVAQ